MFGIRQLDLPFRNAPPREADPAIPIGEPLYPARYVERPAKVLVVGLAATLVTYALSEGPPALIPFEQPGNWPNQSHSLGEGTWRHVTTTGDELTGRVQYGPIHQPVQFVYKSFCSDAIDWLNDNAMGDVVASLGTNLAFSLAVDLAWEARMLRELERDCQLLHALLIGVGGVLAATVVGSHTAPYSVANHTAFDLGSGEFILDIGNADCYQYTGNLHEMTRGLLAGGAMLATSLGLVLAAMAKLTAMARERMAGPAAGAALAEQRAQREIDRLAGNFAAGHRLPPLGAHILERVRERVAEIRAGNARVEMALIDEPGAVQFARVVEVDARPAPLRMHIVEVEPNSPDNPPARR